MGWIEWVIITLSSSAGVGLIVRTLTTTAIKHAFEVDLEKLKHRHVEEIERIKGEMDLRAKKELEYVKAEISLYANTATGEADKEKALYMQVANTRATSYPKLVALLRRMKRQFEGLTIATVDAAERVGPINLAHKSKRAEMVRKAIVELAQLEKEFDDELSGVRLFTTRSDYSLQSITRAFCHEWNNKNDIFVFSDEQLRGVIDYYNDDISFLSEEFYKPEIPIPYNSGERLGWASSFPDVDGFLEDVEEAHKRSKPEKTFIDRLISRRPGSSILHNS